MQPSPANAAPSAVATPGPVHLIIDTDMSFDVDDVGAVCIAHELARRGEARIEAIVHDSGLPLGAGALSSLSAFYDADVPLGAYKGTFVGGVQRQNRNHGFDAFRSRLGSVCTCSAPIKHIQVDSRADTHILVIL